MVSPQVEALAREVAVDSFPWPWHGGLKFAMFGTIWAGDMQNLRLMMMVAAGLVLLATALAALDVPLAAVMAPRFSVEVWVGVGLVVALLAAFAGKWRRSRQRKMLRDMRDSALW